MRENVLSFIIFLAAASIVPVPTQAQELHKARRLTSIIVVSPMVGRGTYEDPRRPAVIQAEEMKGEREQAVSFRYLIGDDGRSAIVEISGMSGVKRAELKSRMDLATDVIEKESTRKDDAEIILKRVKKDFRWEDLAGVQAKGAKP